jgi:hypothetical protein
MAKLVIVTANGLSFDDLLLALASRPKPRAQVRLARFPPRLLSSICSWTSAANRLSKRPWRNVGKRWKHSPESFSKTKYSCLSPGTRKSYEAQRWLRAAGGALDGIIAKRTDAAYATGERTAMQKIKLLRSADCVVGGFRYAEKKKVVGSLLLGLYDKAGLLHHVGFCSGSKRRSANR